MHCDCGEEAIYMHERDIVFEGQTVPIVEYFCEDCYEEDCYDEDLKEGE